MKMKIKNPFKKEDPIKTELTRDFADYLMDRGFNPEEAHKTANDFWNKHFNRLKEVMK
jgi:SOS response regulatory protein OraA/RecX